MMTIHLLGFEGKELGDVEPEPDGKAEEDVQQEVSPPLGQGQGHHHEHPEIEKNSGNQQLYLGPRLSQPQ